MLIRKRTEPGLRDHGQGDLFEGDGPSAGLPLCRGGITLRLMTRDDVDEMSAWPYQLDPFYSRGARLPSSRSGRDRWWELNVKGPHVIMLAAVDDLGRLVGRIGISIVDEGSREGVMGIRIRPDMENRGLGTDLLCAFLEYWFEHRQMKILSFDANTLNLQAIGCYRKVGVPVVGYHYEFLPEADRDYGVHPSGFVKYLDYRITDRDYLAQKETKSNS